MQVLGNELNELASRGFPASEWPQILSALGRPPRTSFIRATRDKSQVLQELLRTQCQTKKWDEFTLNVHPAVPDVVYIQGRVSGSIVPCRTGIPLD
jgi:hypothetical protein